VEGIVMGVESAIGGLIVAGVIGNAIGFSEQKKSDKSIARAQERAMKVDLAVQQEQAARERRAQIREARIQRAAVSNLAAASGQQAGSAAIAGGQQATAQMGQNLGNINTSLAGASAQTQAQIGVINAQSRGQSALGAFAGQFGNMALQYGGQGLAKSIFKD
jgi:hypothetical protein